MGQTEASSTKTTRFERDAMLGMHRHEGGYIAIVLDGDYEERSVDGRHSCETGAIVWHPPFHMHENRFGASGAVVLNLPPPPPTSTRTHPLADYRVRAGAVAAEIEKLARRNVAAAANAAAEELRLTPSPSDAPPPWLSAMAAMLRRDPKAGTSSLIGALARRAGISPEHAARTFKEYFGATPVAYRCEHRVRQAMALMDEPRSLADIAYCCGYADQSHLVKEFRKVTGLAPGSFRGR